MTPNLLERLLEFLAALFVEAVDQLLKLGLAAVEILNLVAQELVPAFESFLFLDGVHVHVAQTLDLASQVGDFRFDSLPIHVLIRVALVCLGQVDLQLVPDSFQKILLPDFQLTQFDLQFVNSLLGLGFLAVLESDQLFRLLFLFGQLPDAALQDATFLLALLLLHE